MDKSLLTADKRYKEEKKQLETNLGLHACMREQGRQVGACFVGLEQHAEVVCVGLDLVGRFRPVRMDWNGPEDGPLNRSKGS